MTMTPSEMLHAAHDGDSSALDKMVRENSGLIWSVAKRFFGRGVDPDDLYQLGCVGFLKAVQGFDESFGTQFSTYAVPKISGEIRRFLRDDGSLKVSRSIKERAVFIRQKRSALEQRLGREPTIKELSAETGLAPEDIATCETAVSPSESLQQETGDGGLTLESMLGDWGQEDKLIEKVSLKEAINALPEREKMVVLLRYYRCMTQSSAAKVLNISQVQVSRLEKKAVLHLREELEK